MARRADILVNQTNSSFIHAGGATNYLVQTLAGVLYFVLVDSAQDVSFKKSSDGGLTWTQETIVYTGTVTGLSVWYDRWSGIAADLIHCAYIDSASGDTLYRTIDAASSDALSTETTIFNGATQATGGHLSITRARGGNVYCKTVIDAGAEGGFYRLPNANVPNGAWDAARTVDEVIATQDAMILVPGFAADNQDIMAVFWDDSATEISQKIYDDSGNSWAETSIATSMTKPAATASWPPFDAVVDLTNSRIIIAAWSTTDTANGDLRVWTMTESTITETTTNAVLNSVDDQGLVGLTLDLQTGFWHVYYVGKSDGSETFVTAVNVYTKVSQDGGVTWGPETLLTTATTYIPWVIAVPRLSLGHRIVGFLRYSSVASSREVMVNVDRTTPRASSLIGVA